MKALRMLIGFMFTLIASLTLASTLGSVVAVPVIFGISIVSGFMPIGNGVLFDNIIDTTFTQGICERVQRALNDIYKKKSPSLLRTPVGYLEAIRSSTNMSGVEVIPIDPGNGKIKAVRLKINRRGCESDITDELPEGCVPEIEDKPYETIVEDFSYIGTKGMEFSEDEMRKLCEADSEWMAKVINGKLDPLMTSLNKALLTLQAANFGNFVPDISPTTYKAVDLLFGQKSEPLFYGESQILEDFENLDGSIRPMLIGAGNLSHYARQIKIGCCNDGGIDLNNAGSFDYYRDIHAGTIFGDSDRFAGVAPGYVQLLTWNRHAGSYIKEGNTFSHTTIVDPKTGMKLDMSWHYNDCNPRSYYVDFGIHYNLYFLPQAAWNYCDRLSGVNFTLGYKGDKLDDCVCTD